MQGNQESLAQRSNLLDERQIEANERDNTCKKKEKELDEASKSLENSNVSLKSREEDMCTRLRDFDAKEKVFPYDILNTLSSFFPSLMVDLINNCRKLLSSSSFYRIKRKNYLRLKNS